MELNEQTTAQRYLWWMIGVLSVLVMAAGGYKFYHRPSHGLEQQIAPDPSCDLHSGKCTLITARGESVTFSIAPRPIPLIQPLELSVDVQGGAPSSVSVEFVGVDMDMGFNRFVLQARGQGQYSGHGMLPICTRSHMRWEARVVVEQVGESRAFPFRFDTVGQ